MLPEIIFRLKLILKDNGLFAGQMATKDILFQLQLNPERKGGE